MEGKPMGGSCGVEGFVNCAIIMVESGSEEVLVNPKLSKMQWHKTHRKRRRILSGAEPVLWARAVVYSAMNRSLLLMVRPIFSNDIRKAEVAETSSMHFNLSV